LVLRKETQELVIHLQIVSDLWEKSSGKGGRSGMNYLCGRKGGGSFLSPEEREEIWKREHLLTTFKKMNLNN